MNNNGNNRTYDGKFSAPVLWHVGSKEQKNDCNQSYIIPQSLGDIIFNELGNSSAQLRIMIVLCGTKPGFRISEQWICNRTGLTRQSYERARTALIERGWLSHEQHQRISVNFAAIYKNARAIR